MHIICKCIGIYLESILQGSRFFYFLVWVDYIKVNTFCVIIIAIINITVNLEGGWDISSAHWSFLTMTWGILVNQVHQRNSI